MMTFSATGLMSAKPLRPYPNVLRHLRFGGKWHRIGDLYLLTAVKIFYPALWQVQLPIDEGSPFRSSIGQKSSDLTLLTTTGGAGAFPLHAYALGPLLEKRGLPDHQDGPSVAQMLLDTCLKVVSGHIGMPLICRQQLLHPMGRTFSCILGRWPAVFVFSGAQQALHVSQRPLSGLRSCKVVGQSRMHRPEPHELAPYLPEPRMILRPHALVCSWALHHSRFLVSVPVMTQLIRNWSCRIGEHSHGR